MSGNECLCPCGAPTQPLPYRPTWDSSYETGHPPIDAEHREFFGKLQSIKNAIDVGAGREKTVELIVLLQRYALMHFAHEEEYMRQAACPSIEENAAAHRAFSAKVEGWLDLLTMGGSPVSVLSDVHRESSAWIQSHILHVDCGLRGCRVAKANPAFGTG